MSKAAIVTGANGGIGLAICRKLSEDGHRVVALSTGEAGKGDWPYYQCDLADLDAVRRTFARVVEEHGPVGTLVNNAAAYHAKTFFDITPEDYERTFAVNVRAIFFAAQIVARSMIEGGGGHIVNIGARSGKVGSLVTDYGASKAAVAGLTRSLARTLGSHGITVTALSLGMIETPMSQRGEPEMVRHALASVPLKRPGSAEEVAALVAFLAGGTAPYVTGAVIDFDGGA